MKTFKIFIPVIGLFFISLFSINTLSAEVVEDYLEKARVGSKWNYISSVPRLLFAKDADSPVVEKVGAKYESEKMGGDFVSFSLEIIGEEIISGVNCSIFFMKMVEGKITSKLWIGKNKSNDLLLCREERSWDQKTVFKTHFNPPLIYLPKSLPLNKPVKSTSQAKCTRVEDGIEINTDNEPVSLVVTSFGKVNLTTPSGTFNNCLKIFHKFFWDGKEKGANLKTDTAKIFWPEYKVYTYIWFASGVGQVKFHITENNQSVLELTDYKL